MHIIHNASELHYHGSVMWKNSSMKAEKQEITLQLGENESIIEAYLYTPIHYHEQ